MIKTLRQQRSPRRSWWAIALGAGLGLWPLQAATYVSSNLKPPPPPREFRGAWVASVSNIDWPSKPGLPVEQQKAELVALLDLAARLKLNAVILQVRPACDALYASALEPWSEYLTGQMGRAPKPFYDPLELAVNEAHKRGLELHAWFNPYRARHPSAKSPLSTGHISQTQPALVKTYGKHLWLDPGERAVQDYSLAVILGVVRRYDVDGVHLDDYFYPYRERDEAGKEIPFPDDPSWGRYQAGGGRLSREDWRRENINTFIKRLHEALPTVKRWVKFGVSPFGIWQPGFPPQIKGLNSYEKLFADSRKWLHQGWLDYFTPQLYWAIEDKEQSFTALLKWWAGENRQQRHLWPGLNTSKTRGTWPAEEITRQIRFTRQQPGATGHLHWSLKALRQNSGGLADELQKGLYAQPALIPASPWLGNPPQGKSRFYLGGNPSVGISTLTWEPTGNTPVRWWMVQSRSGGQWTTDIFPGEKRSASLTSPAPPDVVALTAVDRCGNLSPATVVERKRK